MYAGWPLMSKEAGGVSSDTSVPSGPGMTGLSCETWNDSAMQDASKANLYMTSLICLTILKVWRSCVSWAEFLAHLWLSETLSREPDSVTWLLSRMFATMTISLLLVGTGGLCKALVQTLPDLLAPLEPLVDRCGVSGVGVPWEQRLELQGWWTCSYVCLGSVVVFWHICS